ncbi:hypothetical protein LGH74_24355 [Hymenobacter sp. BT178]|uniref:Type II secretion system protein n=1 Tax=Hymenobacter lucidus TaxID=2880930 RepID=A0ABS8AZA9_9BACT|nr:hypothetical protein [Hymenobacter lucidus]
MAAVTSRRLAASSLVEVIVAAAILVLILGMGLGVCARLALTGPNRMRVQSQLVLRQVAAETIRTRAWRTQTTIVDEFEVEQEVLAYGNLPHLLELRLTARVGEKTMAQFQQLVYAHPDVTP